MLDPKELDKLVPIIDADFKGKTSAISESEIQKFLQRSEMVALPSDVKLIALASSLIKLAVYLDWSSYRLIYDVALQQTDDSSGIRAVWLNLALSEWLEAPSNCAKLVYYCSQHVRR